MSRLTHRATLALPAIRRRQDRIDQLEQQLKSSEEQLKSSEQRIGDLKDSYEKALRRSRDEAAKWRNLTRSKVSQLEDKSAELTEARKQLKAARSAAAEKQLNSTRAVPTEAATLQMPEAHIPPETHTPSGSSLVAANTRFVETHLAHRWLDFTVSEDARSHSDLIRGAAEELGFRVRPIGSSSYFFDDEGRCIGGLQGMKSSLSGVVASKTAASKEVLKELLREANLPTPKWAVFSADDKHLAFEYVLERNGSPLVMKPIDGRQGLGVTTGITDVTMFGAAWDRAATAFSSGRVMIEEEVAGVDVRVFVVAGKAVAAAVRIPPFVMGDGESTVAELVERLEVARARHAYSAGLEFVSDVNYLARTGVYDSTVLPSGAVQFLNGTANLSQGGVSVDFTDELPIEARRMAESAAGQVPGLQVGGVDLLLPTTESAEGAVVLEMNAWANLRPHVQPAFGNPRDVATAVVAEMIQQTKKAIPLHQ